MEKYLKLRLPTIDFLSSVDSGIKEANRISYETLLNSFDRVGDEYSFLLSAIFYDYLNYISKTKEKKKTFVRSINDLKHIKYDQEIIDFYKNIVRILSDKIYGNYNLIGGKVADLLDGKTFEESTGDFDIWITGSGWIEDSTINNILESNPLLKLDEDKFSRSGCFSFLYESVKYNKKINIQLIHNYDFNVVDDIFNKFDFLHCCVGIDSKDIFWRQGALKAIKQKNIIFNGLYPSRVLHERIMKYVERGYKINYSNFIFASIATILGVVNAPDIDTKMINKSHLSQEWTAIRNGNVYEEVV